MEALDTIVRGWNDIGAGTGDRRQIVASGGTGSGLQLLGVIGYMRNSDTASYPEDVN